MIHNHRARPAPAEEVLLGPPIDGAFDFLDRATHLFTVCVCGNRNRDPLARRQVFRWFRRHGWPVEDKRPAGLYFPAFQPDAFLSLDDRCSLFLGEFPDPAELTKFSPWLT